MNNAKRIYLTINLASAWMAGVFVCDAIGLGKLNFVYGAVILFALAMSTLTAFELSMRNNK